MAEHIVSSYDNDLQGLRRRISEMGGIAEKMLVESIAALVRHDKTLAQTVISSDSRLDVLQREVEESAILTIARRQPLAVDLRETISAIRERTHWNSAALTPMDPVTLGLCSQLELDFEVNRANKEKPPSVEAGGATLLPASETTRKEEAPAASASEPEKKSPGLVTWYSVSSSRCTLR